MGPAGPMSVECGTPLALERCGAEGIYAAVVSSPGK